MPSFSIHLVAGARPNFMKIAPVWHALRREAWARPVFVHTGQHYDPELSDSFLADLELPRPDHHLQVGSGSHAEQTAGVMLAYEKVCLAERPDWVIVVGDVNSTLACSIVTAKLLIPTAHLEAGLRSRDRTMPEEINRLVTDAIADVLWTPSPDADENLRNEGVAADRIERVGNIMIDSYELMRPKIEARGLPAEMDLPPCAYGVVTLHRPANVDEAARLEALLRQLIEASRHLTLVFAVHPRTRARMEAFGLNELARSAPGLRLIEPLGYVDFMSLVGSARLAITDSGGMQEETTYLGIPCLTVRDTTERPITVSEGTNRLVAPDELSEAIDEVLQGQWPKGRRPDLWDGRTADRVVASLRRRLTIP